MKYEEGKTYTVKELFDDMPVSIRQLAQDISVNEVTLARVRDARPTRRATANKLLRYFSTLYGGDFTLRNVAGINIKEYPKKRTESHTEPPKPIMTATATPESIAYAVRPTKRKSGKPLSSKKPLPDGWEAWNSFCLRHNLPPSSFDKRDYIESGLEFLQGNVIVRNPLDPAGQDMLLTAGKSRYPGRFKVCDVSGCPCHA